MLNEALDSLTKISTMKKELLTGLLMLSILQFQAQSGLFNRVKQRVSNKVNQKVDSKVDNAIDKTIDQAEQPGKVGGAATDNSRSASSQSEKTARTEQAPQSVGTVVKANSKFDFIPGEKIVAFEDFVQDAIGDFPDKWNTTSSGEIQSIDGQKGKWLALTKPGIFYPEFIETLPENFTLEYDVAASNNYSSGSASFEINIVKVASEVELKNIVHNSGDRFRALNTTDGITVQIHPNESGHGRYNYRIIEHGVEQLYHPDKQYSFTLAKNIVHVSIWKQKTRIRMYLDQEKIFDLPKVMTSSYNRIIFSPNYSYANNEDKLYLTNLRLAVGDADTRNKLVTEGKFVTHGILFESGSDKISPQSYGTLKEIAGVLSDNPTLKVTIIGHTDSDGEDAANLLLSQKRAAAVKNTLVTDFMIEASRMETSGKGETQPLQPNTTAESKANNRRVEFLKQ
jgi:OmpA-OmpF porin, OOP family